jgi:hypothetical protein
MIKLHGYQPKPIIAAIILSVLMVTQAVALDIEAGGFFGNFGLPWAGEAAMTEVQYPANLWLYGGQAAFVQDLGENFSLRVEYETDTVLRNIVRGVVSYETGIASISAGPMVGALNTPATLLKAGIDIGFRLDVPGMVFFSTQVESSMGAGMVASGDYSQERSELTAGWYVYNAICTVSLLSKRYTRILDSGDALVDASNDYTFSVDVHKKGAPYRIIADLGYRSMTRAYPDDTVDGLGAVALGAKVSADISPMVTLDASLDSGVYVFGLENLAGRGPAPESFIFSTGLALTIHLETKPTPDQ